MKRSLCLLYIVAIRLLLFPGPSPLEAASPNSAQYEPMVHSSYAALSWTDSVMNGTRHALMQNGAIVWATAAVVLVLSGLIALLVVAVVRRRRAEEALRQANLVVESSPVVLFRWIATEGWPVALVSKNVIQFGYTPEELITGTVPFSSLVHPEDLERVATEVQAYAASGVDQFHQQYRLVTKAGDVRWVDDHTVIERSPDGQAVSYRGTVIDITERKRAEEALQESERKFRDLAEKAVVGVYIIQDKLFKYVNARFAEMHGRSVSEMTGGMPADEAIFPEDLPVVAETVQKRSRGEVPPSQAATFRIVTKSGELRYVEDYSTSTLYRGQPAMIGTAVDVTERKRAEEALRLSEERFRTLIESSPLPIVMARDGQFIYVNNAYCRMIGVDSPDQMLHTSLLETVAPEKREEVRGYMAARAKNEPAPVHYESVGIRRDGTRFHYENSVAKVNLADGPALIAFINDITERRRVEEALEKRLVALTRPIGEGGEIAFEDLFDLADLQSLQDRFSEACGVASLITYPDGKPITRPTNFSSLCGEIIRKTPKGLRNCEHSDAMIGRYNPSGPIIQPCLSVGLRNAGASISLGGRHLANWLIGQVRDEAKSEEEIVAYAREIGADETAFLEAYRRIPVMSEERFEQIAQALFVLAHQLSSIAHQNVQQARFINERKSAEDTVRQNEAVLRSLLEATPAGVALLVDRVFLRVNPALCTITGYSEEEMIGMETQLLYPDEETYERAGRELYEHMARTGMGISETHLRRKDGAVIDVLLCQSPFDPTDADKGVTATVLDITERKRAEEALRASEAFLDTIIEHSPQPMAVYDHQGILIRINQSCRDLLHITDEEVIGKYRLFEDNIIEEHGAMPLVRRVFEGGEKARFILPYDTSRLQTLRFDETVHRVLDVNLSPVLDAQGRVVNVVVQQIDITEQRMAEEALKAAKKWFEDVVEFMPDAIVIADRDRKIIAWNRASEKMTGIPKAAAMGLDHHQIAVGFYGQVRKTLMDLAFVDDEELKTGYSNVRRLGSSVYAEAHTPAVYNGRGAYVLAAVSPFYDEEGNLIGIIESIRDITELKRAEEETRRLRNFLSNIIDSMPSVLVGVDVNGCVTQWNNAAEKATGVESKQAMGQMLDQVLPAMHRQANRLRQAMRTRRVETETKVPRIVNGEIRYEDVTVYPLTCNGIEGAVIRVDDVTERVRIEEMIVQSEKMLSVGGLAAGMAHEINNPLGVILQAVQNLQRRVSPDLPINIRVAEECGISLGSLQEYLVRREVPTFLEDIRQSGRRAAEIVTNMLNFSRKAEDGGTSTDLAELLDRTLTLAASDYDLKKHYDFRQIEVVREYQPDTPRVICQSGKIQQVFLNVLRNGAEAMRTGGGTDERPCFILRVFRDNAMVRVEIEDNGPGMNDATRKRVFEPFFTTKPVGSGTGLGLSVSYFIVTEEHGGTLEVESSPGTGTRFIIQLPLEGKNP